MNLAHSINGAKERSREFYRKALGLNTKPHFTANLHAHSAISKARNHSTMIIEIAPLRSWKDNKLMNILRY